MAQAEPPSPSVESAEFRPLKRAIDIVGALILLLILAPVLLAVALVVKLHSPRLPVLFRQVRIGQNDRPFVMLKFRTMLPDRRVASRTLPAGMVDRRRTHKSRTNPRITRVGRVLRRTCIDELPQLWNVLRGEMSLVGPRPELPEIVERYAPWQRSRHSVVPGITGWWQINRNDGRLMHDAIDMDLYYIEHWSLRLDFIILFRTIQVVLRGVGAY
jgi:lipopolysaccharide/colanic/teichoic acid biosynthesis glycosyltransferase